MNDICMNMMIGDINFKLNVLKLLEKNLNIYCIFGCYNRGPLAPIASSVFQIQIMKSPHEIP